MCSLPKIADPLGLTKTKIGDPLGLTKTAIGDPLDVLGNRAAERQQNADAATAAAADAAAKNRPQSRRGTTTGLTGLPSASGGAPGFSTLLTGPGGVNSDALTLGRNTLLGA